MSVHDVTVWYDQGVLTLPTCNNKHGMNAPPPHPGGVEQGHAPYAGHVGRGHEGAEEAQESVGEQQGRGGEGHTGNAGE